ncbi:hypothetical protein [Glycomyces harbinensis]|nr:hypothetical protein [Glycomyces harbinensis]
MTSRKTAYFGVLDSVNFSADLPDDDLAHRTLHATGAVMLQMILGGVNPVLSQTQAFDCAMFTGGLARMDRGSIAMMELVRSGQIQVRILDSAALLDDPADGRRFTLINAFRSALLQRDFRFSSWPELGGDMTLRAAIAEQLDRDPFGVDAVADGPLLHRLLGLIEFDRALRDSPVSERASVTSGASLADRVLGALANIRRNTAGGDTEVLTRLETRAAAGGDGRPFTRRSSWYALLDEYEEVASDAGDPSRLAQLGMVRGLVNAKYNGIVAESLNADGLDVEFADFKTAGIVAQAGVENLVGARATQVLEESEIEAWLTWSELPGILSDMRNLTAPQNRFRHLVSRYREHDIRRRADAIAKNQIWAHVGAVTVNATGTVVGGIVGLALGGDLVGTSIGSVVGTLGGVYANHMLDTQKQRGLRKAELRAQKEFDQLFTPVLGRGSIAYRIDHDA